ncbi:endonuclease III domain-containing protein [Hymenobacter aquaticus]|uniref:endonuclease III domain-containing protein n=1 Tax=Hymenobacter aquaticus TaxID=1867101 RepID=UPI001FD91892|nr:Fe-S cluster assembly protein HesB [Hymenobacter aquaticus]
METTVTVCSDFASCQARALWAHAQLCAEYGAPFRFFSTKDALSELISALLSHRTRNQESHKAYQQLRARFPTWEEVRDAPTADVQAAISPCTWPEQKAPRIQAVLREISARCGGPCDLTFLADMPVAEARTWLESISGVGPKTSAATLLFSSLRIPAMPVDSHHHRVAQRLGLIGPKVGEGPAHKLLEALLPPDWDAQQVYDHHEAFMFHGQKCCYFHSPACGRCVVLSQCPYGQARLHGAATPGAAK